ncbi:tachykinin-like peptides receptor 99D [Oppia nitens]|uniref:tachykinin-like peptides receptor 99D n=1 Tax=Oppia nitens TaxID=1686743 RepID=UPI0023DA14C7|nr:tachykinin-like peptides receptor 99D [Oppia nitens]
MDQLLDTFDLNDINNTDTEGLFELSFNEICMNEIWVKAFNLSEQCDYQLYETNHSMGLSMDNIQNMTSNGTTSIERPFIPRWWIQLFWSLLFGVMVLLSAIGNLVVIWIVLANRRMRTVTNYFLLNLTIADLSTAVFNAIFNFVFMLNSHWPFGQFYCIFNNFIANLSISVSVFTISATSIDR